MFTYVLHKDGNDLVVELGNSINEDFVSMEKENLEGFERIIIDFNKVSIINSSGIREWVKFLDRIRGKKIAYRNCTKIIVDQMNFIHDFLNKHIRVESIYVPYYCERCDRQEMKLFNLEEIVKGNRVDVLDVLCSVCKQSMELEELKKQYFGFIEKTGIKG